MKKWIIFTAGLFFLFLSSCDDQDVKEEDLSRFEKLQWFEGIWEGRQGEATLYESWRRKSFRIMEGISYTTVDKQRVYSQDMRIEQSNNKIYFIITRAAGESAQIKLELTSLSDSTAEFVNEGTEFPKKIIYTREKKNRLNVALLGSEGDENKTEMNYVKTEDFSQKNSTL